LDFLKTKPISTVQDVDEEHVYFEENASVLHSDLDVCDVNVCYLLVGWAVHKQETLIEAYYSGQLALFSAFTLLVGSSDL